jgi:hypothetical protein
MRKHCIWILFTSMALFTACQKVIDVKLNDSEPLYVIEGEITDQAGPYVVTVARSKNFDDDNNFPAVSNAVVVIKDLTTGTQETLIQPSPGKYQTQRLRGRGGRTYLLTVSVDGKTFTASSTMPGYAVGIDTLYASRSDFDSDDIFMVPVFRDPQGKGNYYRLRQWINSKPVKGSSDRRDEATDGQTYTLPLYYSTDTEDNNPLIHQGDTLRAELQCIDRGVYEYFRTLERTVDQNSATPSNPLTNITGGAQGVFNACTSRKYQSIAKFK